MFQLFHLWRLPTPEFSVPQKSPSLCIILPYFQYLPAVALSLKQHGHSRRPIVFWSALFICYSIQCWDVNLPLILHTFLHTLDNKCFLMGEQWLWNHCGNGCKCPLNLFARFANVTKVWLNKDSLKIDILLTYFRRLSERSHGQKKIWQHDKWHGITQRALTLCFMNNNKHPWLEWNNPGK